MESLQEFFASGSFIPHGHCYLWKTELVWLHLMSDLLITLAYYSIPIALVYFVQKREDLPFSWVFLLFSAFIVLCGTTHLLEIWTLWHPTYWVSGGVKAITAVVSVFTASSLVQLIPQAMAVPSPAQLEAANLALANEVAERKRAEEIVRTLNLELEARVEKRTLELSKANAELAAEIVERKQAEAQLREAYDREVVLIKEIHHRVKNNLQIISGLLYLQSRQIEDEKMQQILRSSRDRIQSMTLIHEKLYRSKNLENIDFVAYLHSLTWNLETSYAVKSNPISLVVNAEPVSLDIDTAIYCGLIINELVSNAFKYAFPKGCTGEITIEFHVSEPTSFTLIVRDNGIGMTAPVDLQNSKSLGLQLVHSLATKQLKGTVSLDYAEGVACTVLLPKHP